MLVDIINRQYNDLSKDVVLTLKLENILDSEWWQLIFSLLIYWYWGRFRINRHKNVVALMLIIEHAGQMNGYFQPKWISTFPFLC